MFTVISSQNITHQDLVEKRDIEENFAFYQEKFLAKNTLKIYTNMNDAEKQVLEELVKTTYLEWLGIPLDFFGEHKAYLLDGISKWIFNQSFVIYLAEIQERIELAFKDPVTPLTTTLDANIRKQNRDVVKSIENQNDLFPSSLETYFRGNTSKEIPYLQ